MRYMILILILIAIAVTTLFSIKDNDGLLLTAIVAIIVGFWIAVFQIPKESDS